MKNVLSIVICFLSLQAYSQGHLTISVLDNGLVAPGVSVFFYDTPSQFYPNGINGPSAIENFSERAFTDANGLATFSLANVSLNDTVFWASRDCGGNLVWGSSVISAQSVLNTDTLNLSCLPADCDVIFKVHDYLRPSYIITYVEAFPLRQFSYTALPIGLNARWEIERDTFNLYSVSGLVNADYDTASFNRPIGLPLVLNYARVDSFCGFVTDTIIRNNAVCQPIFGIKRLGQGNYEFLNNSYAYGTIISSTLDFGDGIAITYPGKLADTSHRYTSAGNYPVCLTITAVLGSDTCTGTYCDTLRIGPGGTPLHNCQAGFGVDSLRSGLNQNQIAVWEGAGSNGTIQSYTWDFGDGTVINRRYPTHTYASSGVYQLCLSIVSTKNTSAGTDTCYSTYCDSIGFDANGNLVFKNGFTVNVLDPAQFSLGERLLHQSLSVYPNPSRGKIQLQWDERLKVDRIEIFTIAGKRIRSWQPQDHTSVISQLSKGIYVLRVEAATAYKIERLIVE